jgi:hypothetical protein
MQDFRNSNSRDSIAKPPPLSRADVFQDPSALLKSYPIPLSKKSCARVVTYRQCARQHFEKTPAPLKREYFMNFFLSSCAEY